MIFNLSKVIQSHYDTSPLLLSLRLCNLAIKSITLQTDVSILWEHFFNDEEFHIMLTVLIVIQFFPVFQFFFQFFGNLRELEISKMLDCWVTVIASKWPQMPPYSTKKLNSQLQRFELFANIFPVFWEFTTINTDNKP